MRLCVGLVGGFIGIFIFFVHPRIGRKNLLNGLWTLFTLRKCGGLALISFVGSQQGVDVLRLAFFIFLSTLLLFISLGGWYGNRRFLQGWLSFHGQLLLVRFLQLTFAKGTLLFLIGVTCVRDVRNRWIIFCFITPITFEMWSLVLCLFGLHWVIPQKVIELFESWQINFRQHRNIDFWRLVPHCLMWCIWSERNATCFEGCKQSLLEIKSFFLHFPCLECGSVTLFLSFPSCFT